jgi:CRP-like cAMP-binding protein
MDRTPEWGPRRCAGTAASLTAQASSLHGERVGTPGLVWALPGGTPIRNQSSSVAAVSPRHVPATITELSRIGLLSSLPGERLNVLATRMQREELQPGAPAVEQGEPGERFYVVLSGLLNVSQDGRGGRTVLRPGDYFGEVALAMDIPRTATVRAMTLSVVASCDRATFDELLRPLFADD